VQQKMNRKSSLLVEAFHILAAEQLWSVAMYLGNSYFIADRVIRIVHIQRPVLHAGIAKQYHKLHSCRLVDFLHAATVRNATL